MEITKLDITDAIAVTSDALLTVIKSFTEPELNVVPFKGSWTGGQVAEHLIMAGDIAQAVYGRTSLPGRNPVEKLGPLADAFLDFSIKMQTPDFIAPAIRYYYKEQLLQELEHIWSRLARAAAEFDLSELCLDFAVPVLGELTRMEWIWFYIYHSQRHINQLKNIHAVLVDSLPVSSTTRRKLFQ